VVRLTVRRRTAQETSGPDDTPDRPLLAAADVAVWYGKFQAVESASFHLRAGEFVSIIGPNGHGKSSLVGALAGVVARRGEVRMRGERLPSGDPVAAIRAGLVLVPERRHMYPGMTVRDNIVLGCYSRTGKRLVRKAWDEIENVIDLFPELSGRLDQRAGTLSGGEQQMVALARGLAARPDVLVLDEPCLGLSEAVTARVYDALAELSVTRVSVLLVEENPSRALRVSTRILQVHQGSVVP
jgi:branched-chain amino acid transport system ATP-binding protein